MDKATWKEFREAGLFWWINRSLHLFGWSLVYEADEKNNILNVYPARTNWRGFLSSTEEDGFVKLTNHINESMPQLLKDVNETTGS